MPRPIIAIAIAALLSLALTGCPEDAETPDTASADAASADAASADAEADEGCPHARAHHDGGGEGEEAHPWAVLHADGVTRRAENIDGGVKMLFVADCPHLQGRLREAAAAKVEHMTSGAGEDEHGAGHGDCPLHAEGVSVAVEEVENGVALVFTTDDAEQVSAIQEAAARRVAEGCRCGKRGEHGAGHGHGSGDGGGDCGGGSGEECAE